MSATLELLGQFLEIVTGLMDADGVPVIDQLGELTRLLMLRFAQLSCYQELLPVACDWQQLLTGLAGRGLEVLDMAFVQMRDHHSPPIGASFEGASRHLANPALLRELMDAVNGLSWDGRSGLSPGLAYGALITHYAALPRSGVADYSISRGSVETLIRIAKPNLEDVVVDPAAGCASLLVAAGACPGASREPGCEATRGRFFGLLQRPRASPTALANLLLNGLVPITSMPLLHASRAGRQGLSLLPTPTLVVSDLARLGLPLSHELALVRSVGLRLRSRGRAVMHVSEPLCGNSPSVRRLRAEWDRFGLSARFQPLPDEGLLLRLRKEDGAPRDAPLRRRALAWPSVKLSVLVRESRHGVVSARQTPGDGVPLVRVQDIEPFTLNFQFLRRATIGVDGRAFAVQPGDLLVARAGPLRAIGNCCCVAASPPNGTVYSDKLIRLRVDTRRVLPRWIEACLNATAARQQLQRQALACGGQYRITRKMLLALQVPLPSLEEQCVALRRQGQQGSLPHNPYA